LPNHNYIDHRHPRPCHAEHHHFSPACYQEQD
jgi:hypothetical protein